MDSHEVLKLLLESGSEADHEGGTVGLVTWIRSQRLVHCDSVQWFMLAISYGVGVGGLESLFLVLFCFPDTILIATCGHLTKRLYTL